jgi:iron complex transport system ATP-binding protein
MLCAHAINLTLSGRLVLRDVSAGFAPGKVSIILGPNGAGKSSLLACLSGQRKPEQGIMTLTGEPLHKLSAKHRACRIGLLPQSGDVHWDIEARALIALGRFAHVGRGGLSLADEAAIDAAMLATDTTGFATRNILQLSGGERARVLLARVLAGEPEWLLADEPLANLDPGHQIDLLTVLRKQAAAGVGVIAVLHDLNHAAGIADHIVLMKDGMIMASGDPETIFTPANLAKVYGIKCAVSQDAGGRVSVSITGRDAA